eukprot:TRINITY_DN22488_c0_g2_i1.p1 TRINITY_DN22488_c0_g2~~TRINITY_DN22488_c0_g2_i1.p1  ORF type:complete len:390 (-),score=77.50 TRINITY_DN22488_c0_g2_i1:122-1216(-)
MGLNTNIRVEVRPQPDHHANFLQELLDSSSLHNLHQRQQIPETTIDLGAPNSIGLPQEWAVLAQTVAALLAFDFFVLRKVSASFRNHLALTVFWICIGLLFNVHIWHAYGASQALYWLSGYTLEWMLSMDNLVVFSLILTTYRTPAALVHKALYIGLAGAVLLRLCFFLVLEELLKHEAKLQVLMGCVLMFSGGQAMFEEDDGDEGDMVDTVAVRTTQAFLGRRLEQRYDLEGQRLFVFREGQYRVTLLAFVVILLEITDLMFALDSVSAKIAAVPNQFIAYSSTVMAVFGLRAAFFIIHDLVSQIEVLKYGVAFIVAYIGVSLILSRFRQVPEWSTCAVSTGVLILCTAVHFVRGSGGREKRI